MIFVSYAGLGRGDSLGELVFGAGQDFNCTNLGKETAVCFGSTTRRVGELTVQQLFVRLQQLINIVGQGLDTLGFMPPGFRFKPIGVDGLIGLQTVLALDQAFTGATTAKLEGLDPSFPKGTNQTFVAKNADQYERMFTTMADDIQRRLLDAGLPTITATTFRPASSSAPRTVVAPASTAAITTSPAETSPSTEPEKPKSKLPWILGAVAAAAVVGVVSYAVLRRRRAPTLAPAIAAMPPKALGHR